MDLESFRQKFPEFASEEDATIETAIAEALIESNGYLGLEEPQRTHAQALHAAAILCLQKEAQGRAGAITSVESRNDKISYAVKDVEPYSMDSNQYGKRLKSIILTNYY
jgi:hypothetical protein